jgi:alpha-tubulin suppressor-like RCC1 family protein
MHSNKMLVVSGESRIVHASKPCRLACSIERRSKSRRSFSWMLAFFLVLFTNPVFAQDDMIVTNLACLAQKAFNADHCLYLPGFPLYCQYFGVSLDGGLAWWVDCSQVGCTNLPPASTDASANALLSGVTILPVQLTWNILTGETTLQPYGSTDIVAVIAAPSDYQPGAYSYDAGVWRAYLQMTNCPDCWGIEGEVPPPTVVVNVNVADLSQYSIYENNCEAQAEAAAAEATTTSMMGGRYMAMDEDDDDGGDPCTLTNLLQAFYVTNIVHNATGSTTITWESCQYLRYLVFTASSLNTNTQWIPQAYVWGQTNASWTTWTDTATTNDDGSTITQRFYRVQRIPGSPIAAGGESSVAIRPDGTLWAWGNNDGNLGDGLDSTIQRVYDPSFVERYLPYPSDVADAVSCGVQSITNTSVVAAGGDDYTVVVDTTGTVWTFGENDGGQLGNTSIVVNGFLDYPTPIIGVTGFTNVVNVAAGYQHTLALCANGTVWAWGNDCFGPKDINGYCQADGALGLGTLLSSMGLSETNLPFQTLIPTNTMIVAIAAGDAFSLAVGTNGLVWGWGDNEYGEIGSGVASGIGTTNGSDLPILVQGVSNVIAIAAGANAVFSDADIPGGGHSIALTADKRVWTWGDNEFGELGRTTTNALTYDPSPGLVTALTNQNVVAIAGGLGFTLAVTSNGQVFAWGDNTFGELGTNTSAVALTNRPMLVSGISNVVWVSAPRSDDGVCDSPSQFAFCTNYAGGSDGYLGGVHVMAMTLDPVDGSGKTTNNYWGWGDNSYGQVGNELNGGGSNQVSQYTPAGPLQFCTRCQREVQLGTSGSFTAECNGTLYLYFNTDNFGGYNTPGGSYSATVNGSNVTVYGTNSLGVSVGAVTVGNVYTYSATGLCVYTFVDNLADANGMDSISGSNVACSFGTINMTNSICPLDQCFSLVGKIQ